MSTYCHQRTVTQLSGLAPFKIIRKFNQIVNQNLSICNLRKVCIPRNDLHIEKEARPVEEAFLLWFLENDKSQKERKLDVPQIPSHHHQGTKSPTTAKSTQI